MSEKITPATRLIEVFSAIQGEGINLGTRQIFIRFAICDLRCSFCDSSHTWFTPELCHVEQTPGQRDFLTYPNPVELPLLLQWVQGQNVPGLHDSVTLTGGEPLLQTPFLQEFLPQLRKVTRLPVYLETGGHRPQQLPLVLPYLNTVGMDIKLPSVSGEEHWQAHEEFLELCVKSDMPVFVKLIVSKTTTTADLEKVVTLVAKIDPEIPVILQPVTPLKEPIAPINPEPPTPSQILSWQRLMKQVDRQQGLRQVRVVPQTHKFIGQL